MKQFKFNERQRFSIRKFSIGAASVLLGSVFFAVCSVEDVQAAEQSQNVVSVNENKQTPNPLIPSNSSTTGVSTKKANTSVSVSNVENKLKGDVVGSSQNPQELEPVVSTISDSNERKLALSKLIEEIDGKFTNGKYASKTEESVNQLKAILEEARSVLSNATTESELTQAHSKLVTATTQLKTKQAEKKEAPEVDTTNGKPTVGKKATNTEKASDSNSIANSGSRDERHGKALNRSNPFRTDATTTNDDPSANQTYTAPAENASLTELIQKLKELAEHIENNDKIKNIDSIGATKHVEAGTVKEIDEFGGWKAVDGGKFAIARKTAEGVYPLETINSTLDDTVWLQEQAFDRRTEYTLLLSKSITRANRDEAAWDGSVYKPTGVASGVTKNVARYKGIEKTFTAYSTLDGSDVVVKFKPGYVGDSDGSKANYKVQVYSITGNQETLVYETTFDPSKDANDDKKIVTKATDGKNKVKIRISNTPNSTKIDGGVDHTTRVDFIGKSEAEKLMAKPENLPNGESGTFTSKLIALPKGADHYKVRISLADPNRTGMSYQAWDEKYSVPVTGLDFSISQDTSNVARSLLQRIYEKLKATESADKNGKTPQTIQDYETELEKVKTLLATPSARTADFKQALEEMLAKQLALKVDKTGLTDSKALLDGLVNEDPTPGKTQDTAAVYNAAKQEAVKVIEVAKTVIDNENATVAQVREALATVNAKKQTLEAAKQALVEAATTEEKTKLKSDVDSLVKADITGKTPNSIEAYNTKYEALKAQLEAAKAEAETVLAKENNASKVETQAAQAKVDAVKTELENAKNLLVEAATTEEKTKLKSDVDSLVKADITGKTPNSIAAYERKYEELKAQLEAAKEEAEKVLAKENNASKVEAQAAQAKVDAVKTELENAKNLLVEAATTEEKTKLKTDSDALKKADTTGKTADSIKAYEAEYEKLKAQLEAAKTEAATALAKADNASKADVQEAQVKVEVAKTALTKAAELLVNKADTTELTKAKKALNTLLTEADPTTGKTADSAKSYNDAKTAATEAIKAAEIVIKDENATQDQVTEALNKVNEKKAALEAAKQALVEAATTEEKAKLKTDADSLVKADETGKTPESIAAYERKYEELKTQLEAAKEEAKKVLAKENNASKAEAQAAQTKVDAAKTALDKAAELLKDLDRDAAKKEIADAAKKATDAIEASTSLTPEQKAEEKAKVAKEAKDATDAIDNATTEEGINSAKDNGKLAIEKEAAITAINDEKAAKEQEIDNNSKLSDEEKVAAKAEVAKASTKAVEAITKAATQDAVDAVKVNGEAAIKAVNPVGKEKALEAIQTVAEAKLAEIDKNTSLSSEEKKVAKAEVAKAAIEAVEAIQKSETQEAVNDAQAKGEAAIKAVNPIGKEKAKAAVEAAAAEKIASIRANPNLSAEEKAKEIAEVERLKQEALNAIDKATTKAELEKALRTFLYQMDQESLVYERPSFDLEAFIQSSITGVVTVERGKAIIQADVISKLNLPENVTVISIELPDTNTLGDKFAKVILRLADGTEITVKVPVRVVALQSGESKPETSFPDYGINNVTTNTDVKVDKAELEGAIRQLDELIIKESAKLDAETAKEANDLLADAKKVFANADASQAEVDAMVKRIEDFMAKVAPATDHATPANDQAAQTSAVAPATTQAATDASQIASAQANTRKVAKELPNTGTADSVVSMLAAATSAVLGLGLAGRRRKEDEEA